MISRDGALVLRRKPRSSSLPPHATGEGFAQHWNSPRYPLLYADLIPALRMPTGFGEGGATGGQGKEVEMEAYRSGKHSSSSALWKQACRVFATNSKRSKYGLEFIIMFPYGLITYDNCNTVK